MELRLPKGRVFVAEAGQTLADVLNANWPEILRQAVAAKLDGQVIGLSVPLENSGDVELLTCSNSDAQQVFWHSASHLMAAAIKDLYPEAQFGVGPAIANGFYYDIKLDQTISVEDLPAIEARMAEIVKEDLPFVYKAMSRKEALSIFDKQHQPFKVELINDLDEDEIISVYSNGDYFMDLCRGPHVATTGQIRHFKLLSVAGAYWRGNETNPVLQRIYGIAFDNPKSLKAHLKALELAKLRDHRKLGKELDLFSFQAEGPGFPFWHPRGKTIYNQVQDYMRITLKQHGYDEIQTPIILNEDLWHRSGHWDNYKENMYFTSIDEKDYAVKPMNCPGCLLLYKNSMHSYRDLPIKLSEMGLVHRHEKSGVLHGLFRVRQFTQDDAHVFCMPEQMEEEVVKLIDLIYEIYKTFGFSDFQLELSTRPAKSIGSDEMWAKAEEVLFNALKTKEIDYQLNKGDGAFYGPKIDFHIRDSLGRMWQCGTIQVDFSMPERFDLEYTGADGQKHQPVMIHRAILGSVERFIGILIEHYGGAFPLWLAPIQCIIMPITDKQLDFAQDVNNKLLEVGIRSELDSRNEKIGYKIREAEHKKTPYICVIGDREVESRSLALRKHKEGQIGDTTIEEFIKKLNNEVAGRVYHKKS
ncbi:threonine--tRNA ligase [bacterium]|nr:threonine--tRNA ligase [bacterium]